eukprot:7255078-Alexandrium_andersonii.AAC.1
MSASLVGSEMCIRDRAAVAWLHAPGLSPRTQKQPERQRGREAKRERHRHQHGNTETDRQTDRQTEGRQADKQARKAQHGCKQRRREEIDRSKQAGKQVQAYTKARAQTHTGKHVR